MAKRNRKKPKRAKNPSVSKTPRTGVASPSGFDTETICWRFSIIDMGGLWGWDKVPLQDIWSIIDQLKSKELQTCIGDLK